MPRLPSSVVGLLGEDSVSTAQSGGFEVKTFARALFIVCLFGSVLVVVGDTGSATNAWGWFLCEGTVVTGFFAFAIWKVVQDFKNKKTKARAAIAATEKAALLVAAKAAADSAAFAARISAEAKEKEAAKVFSDADAKMQLEKMRAERELSLTQVKKLELVEKIYASAALVEQWKTILLADEWEALSEEYCYEGEIVFSKDSSDIVLSLTEDPEWRCVSNAGNDKAVREGTTTAELKYWLGLDEPKKVEPVCIVTTAQRRLDSLIGLGVVKEKVQETLSLVKLHVMRKAEGLPDLAFSNHLVFTGNPGTGKTTVAELVGEIYRDCDLLKKGHFTKVRVDDLVAGYIGHSATKTAAVCEKALDGVLFIDEAYTLVHQQGEHCNFGDDVISTLMQYMEEYRDRLVVIVAGYTEEMQDFLKMNPGLESRFKTVIDFPDYSDADLASILLKCVADAGCTLAEEEYATRKAAEFIFSGMKREKGFGNGRAARNLFEQGIARQAQRLQTDKSGNARTLKFFDLIPNDAALATAFCSEAAQS